MVDLLGMEFARPDELGGVLEHSGPVKATAKSFTSEGARRRVVAAISSMDVSEQLSPLLGGDALQRDSIGALAVKVAVPDAVGGRLANYALSSRVVLREGPAFQVGLDLRGPGVCLWLQLKVQSCP